MTVTETGYFTAPISTDGVDQIAQAIMSEWQIFDFYQNGNISRMYFYELIDEACDPGNTNQQYHYGLFDCNNNPKTVATMIKNLVGLLQDTGASATTFTPAALDWALDGLPQPNMSNFIPGGFAMLLQKSNGRFYIPLWYETTVYGWQCQCDISVTAASVNVSFGRPFTTINVYDPINGSSPINTYSNASSLTVSLGAHPLVIEMVP